MARANCRMVPQQTAFITRWLNSTVHTRWLEEGEPGSASQAINKAHKVVAGLNDKEHIALLIRFRVSHFLFLLKMRY